MPNIRSSKAKGARLQNAVKEMIEATFPQLEEGDVKCAVASETGVDIHLSPAARRLFPFSVECKNQETTKVWEWYEQAETNTVEKTFPLVVFKRNRSDIMALLKLEDLLTLIK